MTVSPTAKVGCRIAVIDLDIHFGDGSVMGSNNEPPTFNLPTSSPPDQLILCGPPRSHCIARPGNRHTVQQRLQP